MTHGYGPGATQIFSILSSSASAAGLGFGSGFSRTWICGRSFGSSLGKEDVLSHCRHCPPDRFHLIASRTRSSSEITRYVLVLSHSLEHTACSAGMDFCGKGLSLKAVSGCDAASDMAESNQVCA
jgi:hypothetical protein